MCEISRVNSRESKSSHSLCDVKTGDALRKFFSLTTYISDTALVISIRNVCFHNSVSYSYCIQYMVHCVIVRTDLGGDLDHIPSSVYQIGAGLFL